MLNKNNEKENFETQISSQFFVIFQTLKYGDFGGWSFNVVGFLVREDHICLLDFVVAPAQQLVASVIRDRS